MPIKADYDAKRLGAVRCYQSLEAWTETDPSPPKSNLANRQQQCKIPAGQISNALIIARAFHLWKYRGKMSLTNKTNKACSLLLIAWLCIFKIILVGPGGVSICMEMCIYIYIYTCIHGWLSVYGYQPNQFQRSKKKCGSRICKKCWNNSSSLCCTTNARDSMLLWKWSPPA